MILKKSTFNLILVRSQATENQRVFTPLDSSQLSFSHSFPAASGSAVYGANERENIGKNFVPPEVGKPKGEIQIISRNTNIFNLRIPTTIPKL